MASHVLVVDDDLDIRDTLCLLLSDVGYAATGVESGRAALDTLRATSRPLIVLLDLLMPEMSGIDVLEAVADDPTLATGHAFILMTADSRMQPVSHPELFGALAVDVVYKPFDVDVILQAITRAERRLSSTD